SSRRRHTRSKRDWSSDVCSSDLVSAGNAVVLTLNPGNFPHGTLAISDRTGAVEFSSPTHEFWGGDSWTYTGPWKSVSMVRTTSRSEERRVGKEGRGGGAWDREKK